LLIVQQIVLTTKSVISKCIKGTVFAMTGVENGAKDKGNRTSGDRWCGTFHITFVCILILNKEF
jgi:hypothetical protein